MHSLKLRSTATRDRLLDEIQLAFNVVSQFDSHTSVAIGRAAQYDSYSMRSIAFLTLTFLPATFVSALFSMPFFKYEPDLGWTVSGKIWVYFAIAGPVTVIVMALWPAWQKLSTPESLIPILRGSTRVCFRRTRSSYGMWRPARTVRRSRSIAIRIAGGAFSPDGDRQKFKHFRALLIYSQYVTWLRSEKATKATMNSGSRAPDRLGRTRLPAVN